MGWVPPLLLFKKNAHTTMQYELQYLFKMYIGEVIDVNLDILGSSVEKIVEMKVVFKIM